MMTSHDRSTSRRLSTVALGSLFPLGALLAAGELAPDAWRTGLHWGFAATALGAIAGRWLGLRGPVFQPLHALDAALATDNETALRNLIETLPAGEVASVMRNSERRLAELRTDVGHVRRAADALTRACAGLA